MDRRWGRNTPFSRSKSFISLLLIDLGDWFLDMWYEFRLLSIGYISAVLKELNFAQGFASYNLARKFSTKKKWANWKKILLVSSNTLEGQSQKVRWNLPLKVVNYTNTISRIKNRKPIKKTTFLELWGDAMRLKSRNPQKEHSWPLVILHIKFQLTSSIWREGERGTVLFQAISPFLID